MSDSAPDNSLTALALRRQFDASFALPLHAARVAMERFLLVRVGVEATTYALRLGQVMAVLPIGTLVSVPTKLPALLGLVAVRGEVIPVYGAAALLGLAQEAPRWFASASTASTASASAAATPSAGSADAVAFAFGHLDGYVEVPSDMGSSPRDANARRVIQTPSGTYGVLDLSGLLSGIQQRIGAARTNKEI